MDCLSAMHEDLGFEPCYFLTGCGVIQLQPQHLNDGMGKVRCFRLVWKSEFEASLHHLKAYLNNNKNFL